jgi:hypothetical protein
MAACPDCGTQNPEGNLRCVKCAAYLPGALEPVSQLDEEDLESGSRGGGRRWIKDWSFLYTKLTLDWGAKDNFVVSRYMSPFMNSETTKTFGRRTWFILNTAVILMFAGLGIAFLIAWQRTGLGPPLCVSTVFIIFAVAIASIFVWLTFVPPRD